MIKIFKDPCIIDKGWGRENVITNTNLYCGKILEYDFAGSLSSAHFHMKKHETFYVMAGAFNLFTWNERGQREQTNLTPGMRIVIPPGAVHQLACLERNSKIFEVSTTHSDDDVYRVSPGDSQKM